MSYQNPMQPIGSEKDLEKQFNESALVILGVKIFGFYIGYGFFESVGEPHQVNVDFNSHSKYENYLLGFWHEHPPNCFFTPSSQDNRSMNGLINYYGKPLISFISNNKGSSCTLYEEGEEYPIKTRIYRYLIRGRLFLAWH
jgi:hypothetical protein